MSDFSYGNRDGRRYKGAPIVAVGAVVDKGVVESVRFLHSLRSVGMTVGGMQLPLPCHSDRGSGVTEWRDLPSQFLAIFCALARYCVSGVVCRAGILDLHPSNFTLLSHLRQFRPLGVSNWWNSGGR